MKKLLSVITIVATMFAFSSCVKQFSSISPLNKTIDGITYAISGSYEKVGWGKGDLSVTVSLESSEGIEPIVKDITVTFDDEEILSEETLAIPWEKNYMWEVKDGKHTLAFSFKTQNGGEGHATIVFEVSGSSCSVAIIG